MKYLNWKNKYKHFPKRKKLKNCTTLSSIFVPHCSSSISSTILPFWVLSDLVFFKPLEDVFLSFGALSLFYLLLSWRVKAKFDVLFLRLILLYSLFSVDGVSAVSMSFSFNGVRNLASSTYISDSTIPLMKGWLTASYAVILDSGLISSIFFKRSKAWLSIFEYSSLVKSKLHALFWAKTSGYFVPSKIDLLKRRWWKIIPAENTSLIGSLFIVKSLMLMISGATKPGVPQRTNKYFS